MCYAIQHHHVLSVKLVNLVILVDNPVRVTVPISVTKSQAIVLRVKLVFMAISVRNRAIKTAFNPIALNNLVSAIHVKLVSMVMIVTIHVQRIV